MRTLPTDIITKSAMTNQTIAADADPYVSLRISRKDTILDNIELVEKVKVRKTTLNSITDADVAVQHPRFRGENTKIWVAYIRNGKLYLRWALDRENITEMAWTMISTGKNAVACACAFDSNVMETARGYQEFVSVGDYPYVFYVDDNGALHYMMLGGVIVDEVLALENVTDVTAVRGPSSKNGGWDMGLTVFFLMDGRLYYRQLIDGVWYDAEQVTLTIPGETIAEIDSFVTWDYRIGVQIYTASHKLYQIITYTEGIGVRGTEHIDMKMSAKVKLSGIDETNQFNHEHISMGMSAGVQLIYGLSCVPVNVQNVQVLGNWGTTIQITFDYPVHSDGLTAAMFSLVDEMGNNYVCHSFSINGRVLTLTFDDFNLAGKWDDVTVSYTMPQTGGLMSPAVQTDSFSETFEPINLTPPLVDPPTYHKARNDKAGETVYLMLTEAYTNNSLTGMASHFSIGCREYDYVPNGTLQTTGRAVTAVSEYEGLVAEDPTLTNATETNGTIALEMD